MIQFKLDLEKSEKVFTSTETTETIVDFKETFGIVIYYTDVYEAILGS